MTHTDVLELWFGSADPTAACPPELRRRWYAGGPDVDTAIIGRFGALFERPEEVEAWPDALSAVVVFDQLARNAFRGTAKAFAFDARALRIATRALAAGTDRALGTAQRMFLYMPFEHAEDLAAQDRAIALFTALIEELPVDEGARYMAFAERHRAIIARFGRFPGRNRALGRASTPEEAAWLEEGGETFGQ